MRNKSLTSDYLLRARARLKALNVLFEERSYADVVRESQEVVELVCKALVRHLGADPARIHDVGEQLMELRDRVVSSKHDDLQKLVLASKELRRDRELAFYGAEDLTPTDFYSLADAESAMRHAKHAVLVVTEIVEGLPAGK